jgi:hypothetical protein
MKKTILRNRLVLIVLAPLFIGILGTGIYLVQSASAESSFSPPNSVSSYAIGSTEIITQTVYLPVVANNYPWISPFGVESNHSLVEGSTYLTKTIELNVGWTRLGPYRVSWGGLQPTEGSPIRWELLTTFENELRSLKSAGIKPVVVIQGFPDWAVVVPEAFVDGKCSPIDEQYFDEFADFMRQLVNRYKTPEFNVHDWEIGNEPDVDPEHLGISRDNIFGCWGDYDDPFYGGEHYGEMLKAVSPVIKAEDPVARLWVGGLLLDLPYSYSNPQCAIPDHCRPELFFEGILVSGAAPFFDIVPYHWHRTYYSSADGKKIDYDLMNHDWEAWGGGAAGKARFLRQLMSEYGVEKPVVLNEIALRCQSWKPDCIPLGDAFYQAQADFLVRALTRALSEYVMGYAWYTLNGPGWENSGLLDENQEPRRSYIAYRHISQLLQNTKYVSTVDYGSDIETYAFKRGSEQVHVLWARTDLLIGIAEPPGFIEAFEWNGNPLPSSNGQLTVGFSPIYLIISP